MGPIVIPPPFKFVMAHPKIGNKGNLHLFLELLVESDPPPPCVIYIKLGELYVPSQRKWVHRVKNTLNDTRGVTRCGNMDDAIAELLRRGAMQIAQLETNSQSLYGHWYYPKDLKEYYWQYDRVLYSPTTNHEEKSA